MAEMKQVWRFIVGFMGSDDMDLVEDGNDLENPVWGRKQ